MGCRKCAGVQCCCMQLPLPRLNVAYGNPVSRLPRQDADDDSADEEGYHDAPAVYLGGEPPLASADRPSCLHCRGPMQFIGQVQPVVFSDELDERVILLWYCADCRVQCCLDR